MTRIALVLSFAIAAFAALASAMPKVAHAEVITAREALNRLEAIAAARARTHTRMCSEGEIDQTFVSRSAVQRVECLETEVVETGRHHRRSRRHHRRIEQPATRILTATARAHQYAWTRLGIQRAELLDLVHHHGGENVTVTAMWDAIVQNFAMVGIDANAPADVAPTAPAGSMIANAAPVR